MAVFASQVRLLIAALLVCVFTLTPAASAAHDKAEDEHTCELIIVSPDVSPAEDTERANTSIMRINVAVVMFTWPLT
tara:strand:+ start:413 stop:643 length:231 start_codon:yes stop_codon:yes gene_type:complete